MTRERGRSPLWLAFSAGVLVLLVVSWTLMQTSESEAAEVPRAAGESERPGDTGQSIALPTKAASIARPMEVPPVGSSSAGRSLQLGTEFHHFLVVDPNGKPIARAEVCSADYPVRVRALTDNEGRAALRLEQPRPARVLVSSDGFAELHVHLPDFGARGFDAPLRVVLQREPGLIVTVVDPSGEPAAGLSVEVSSELELFAASDVSGGHALQSRRVETDSDGRSELLPVLPDVPFTLTLESSHGTALLPPVPLILHAGEQRTLPLSAPYPMLELRVQVRDEEGRPVNGAQVHLRELATVDFVEQHGDVFGSTDETGDCVFEAVCAARAAVRAEKEGFATTSLPDLALDRHSPLVTLTLGPEHTLDVTIADARGVLRDVDRALARFELATVEGTRVGPGLYRFRQLPEGQVRVSAALAEQSWEQTFDTSDTHATLVIPALGALELDWSVAEPVRFGLALQFTRRAASAQPASTFWIPVEPGAEPTRGRMTMDSLPPGNYDVCLVKRGYGIRPDVQLSNAAWVGIAAGVTATVTLR